MLLSWLEQWPFCRKTDLCQIRTNLISWKVNMSAVGNVTFSQIGCWYGDRMISSWNWYWLTPAHIQTCSKNSIGSPSETEVIFNVKRESDAFGVLMRQNPRVFVVNICNPSKTGRVKDILSTETGVWVDTKRKMTPLSTKWGVFVDTQFKMMTTSKKRGIFLDDRVGKQKRCAICAL